MSKVTFSLSMLTKHSFYNAANMQCAIICNFLINKIYKISASKPESCYLQAAQASAGLSLMTALQSKPMSLQDNFSAATVAWIWQPSFLPHTCIHSLWLCHTGPARILGRERNLSRPLPTSVCFSAQFLQFSMNTTACKGINATATFLIQRLI